MRPDGAVVTDRPGSPGRPSRPWKTVAFVPASLSSSDEDWLARQLNHHFKSSNTGEVNPNPRITLDDLRERVAAVWAAEHAAAASVAVRGPDRSCCTAAATSPDRGCHLDGEIVSELHERFGDSLDERRRFARLEARPLSRRRRDLGQHVGVDTPRVTRPPRWLRIGQRVHDGEAVAA